MSHANALLTPRGRLLLAQCVVERGWTLQRAAERFQVSAPTAARSWARYPPAVGWTHCRRRCRPVYLRDDRLDARVKEHGRRCHAALALC